MSQYNTTATIMNKLPVSITGGKLVVVQGAKPATALTAEVATGSETQVTVTATDCKSHNVTG